jgi:hypothetical protein
MKPMKLEALLKRLKNNDPSLTRLSIEDVNSKDWEALGADKAVIALAEALEHNTTVIRFDAAGSGELTDDAARALAKTLKTNRTLAELNLCTNDIKHEGMWALADALRTNNTLVEIYLPDNPAETELISRDLQDAVLANKSKNICLVDFDKNQPKVREFCLNNKAIATKLVGKILNDETITAKDAAEIKDRLPAMGYVLRQEFGVEAGKKVLAILDKAKKIAENTYDPHASDNLVIPVRTGETEAQFRNALALQRMKKGPTGGRGEIS